MRQEENKDRYLNRTRNKTIIKMFIMKNYALAKDGPKIRFLVSYVNPFLL